MESAQSEGEQGMSANNIEGKVIVITGASSGLGEAAARHLSGLGAIVGLGARRVERIEAVAEELNGKGRKAFALATDVTQREQVQGLVDTAVKTYGRVDVIINNAGLMPHSPLERLKVDDWDRMIDVNIKGVLYGIAAVLPHMIRQKSGHVINVSSVAGHKVGPGRSRLFGDQDSRARHVRGPPAGSEAVRYTHDGDLTGCRGD